LIRNHFRYSEKEKERLPLHYWAKAKINGAASRLPTVGAKAQFQGKSVKKLQVGNSTTGSGHGNRRAQRLSYEKRAKTPLGEVDFESR